MKIPGVGPETQTVTNAKGGKQSDTPYGLNLIPPLAILAESKVLKTGAEKYGEGNWKRIEIKDHLNHALQHIYAYLAGDRSDNHLANLACRAHFALELEEEGKNSQPMNEVFPANRCINCNNPLGNCYYGAGDGTGQKFRCKFCYEALENTKRTLNSL